MGATERPRILFLAPRHPVPPWRGDQLRAYHLARHLAREADVRLICFGAGAGEIEAVPIRAVNPSAAGRVLANLRRPAPSLPLQVRAFLNTGMTRAVRQELAAFRPHVLHATLSRMAPYLERGDWHCHLDLVDSMELNMRTRAATSRFGADTVFGLEARLVGRYEARVVADVDSASVVSAADRAAPGLGAATVIPNGVDTEAFPYSEPGDRPPVVLFFGNLGYFHNVGPARFLADEVIERVRSSVPEAALRLAGARPAAAVRRLARPGVEVVANPPEMVPVLHSAAVAALPMLSGSGMKNKVLEAFCAGTPVVTNRLGIEGVDAVAGTHYLVAETKDEIAAAISSLLLDPAERIRLANGARELVVARYSWGRRAEALLSLYRV